ncbi:MAG: response regulator [Candidatus Rokubacteria bacterium]|nr:response regulator [Candidatus Rokubacteria bacterium]
MSMLRGLQGRILGFLGALLVVLQVAVFFVVDMVSTRAARAQLERQLTMDADIFRELLARRTAQLTIGARVLSGDYALKTVVATGDDPTIRTALNSMRLRIGADRMLLVDDQGRVRVDTRDAPGSPQPSPFPRLVALTEDRDVAAAVDVLDGLLYQFVVVPLLAPDPVAWVGLGFVIDDDLASELRRLTAAHVTFLAPRTGGGWIAAASTLSQGSRDALARTIPPRLDQAPTSFALDREDYLVRTVPLEQADGRVGVVIQVSLSAALEPAAQLRVTLMAVFAGALLLSILVGVVIARMVSKPVRDVVRAVRTAATGDYAHRVPVRGADELGELARAVNHMAATLAERETALRRSEEQLGNARKMEAVGRLAGGIAHDFNNLLVVIMGRAEAIRDALAPDDPRRADVLLVEETAERAAGLVRQLLAFSRRQVLRTRVLSLNTVIETFEPMLRRLTGEHVTLSLRLAPDVVPVRADAGQIEQVLLNLVINARDALPDGGRVTIETANGRLPATGAPCAVLAVRDTGTGIPSDMQEHIFEPFFTTKEVGKGTGLGLATVYGIVAQHGGEIMVLSAPGSGSHFSIYLPQAPVAPIEPLVTSGPAPADTRGTETVLVVEDEAEVRRLMAAALRARGYTVLEAADGAAAVALATRQRRGIDLVVADVVMPTMGGREMLAQLRAKLGDVRVLLVSGHSPELLARYPTMAEPAIGFLHKPFTMETLARKARELLDGA